MAKAKNYVVDLCEVLDFPKLYFCIDRHAILQNQHIIYHKIYNTYYIRMVSLKNTISVI